MKDFLFVFRADYLNMPQVSPEEMQAMTKRWMDWIGGIAAQQKLADRGNRLELPWLSGKVAALGRETGVPTPTHSMMYAMLKPYIAGAPV